MKLRLLSFVLLFLTSAASAQALWRGVPAGASPAEVRQEIVEAIPSRPTTLAQTPQALLEVPSQDIAGGDFVVHFLFERERLQSVVLRSDTGSPEAARALAQRVYASLRARYGLELSSKRRGATVSTTMDRHWLFRRTTVHLTVVDGSSVVLTYGVEAPRQTNAL